MQIEYPIQPRISETDMMGHINNVSFAIWFEDARVSLMQGIDGAGIHELMFILAQVHIDYRAEVHYGHEVTSRVWVEKTGSSSITFGHEILQNGKVGATGQSVMVHLDAESRRPQPIPDKIRRALITYSKD